MGQTGVSMSIAAPSLEGSPNGFDHGAKAKTWPSISRVEAGCLESGCVAIGSRPDCGRSRWAASGRTAKLTGRVEAFKFNRCHTSAAVSFAAILLKSSPSGA